MVLTATVAGRLKRLLSMRHFLKQPPAADHGTHTSASSGMKTDSVALYARSPMTTRPDSSRHPLLALEDWWAIWLAGLLLALVVVQVVTAVPGVGRWSGSPLDAFGEGRSLGLIALGLVLTLLTTVAVQIMGGVARSQALGFLGVFTLAVAAYTCAQQTSVRAAGLGYAFWALAIGLVIANAIGTPGWIKPALRSELYIKTGLVLLGAEILFGNILILGLPGLFVAWIVTPTVIVFMYRFGTRQLKIESRALVIVIAAATSVCGVSAAIAAAAAARAKKEELALAVGMSLIFTVVMMVVMPLGIRAVGLDPVVGAAWIGGTVDATGAVVAAGALLGEQAEQIAAVVKMIQNTLIGVVAFAIAVFWVTQVESGDRSAGARAPHAMEVWYRFPKFILGFVAASLVFSFVLTPTLGRAQVEGVLDLTSDLRGWLFCLAFVTIGLESRFRDLGRHAAGGRPVQLYVVGQAFNVVLTLLAAYLAFGGVLFDRIPVSAEGTGAGNVIQNNIDTDVEATALFYTEVPGWGTWIRSDGEEPGGRRQETTENR